MGLQVYTNGEKILSGISSDFEQILTVFLNVFVKVEKVSKL